MKVKSVLVLQGQRVKLVQLAAGEGQHAQALHGQMLHVHPDDALVGVGDGTGPVR